MADVGTGTTLVFGTSGFTCELLNVDLGGIERVSVDTTHLGTTSARTFMPGDLYDPGTIEIEFAYDPDEQPPISGVAETLTITWPIPAGSSSGATHSGSGFVTNFAAGAPLEDKMTATATMKMSGVWTFSDAT